MNLWPAEVGNLSELHLPLFEWMKKQVPSGQHTAQVFYGSRGWTMHTSVKLTARNAGTFFVKGLMTEPVSLKKRESWSYRSVN